ncbi:hypothetical protein SDC9_154835 [bioreactor metagenome]|uniref:Uncharacterized protein n=1 Tax=bioreactor metagenome TaxID=1076179 RepID=A0A645F4M6_9ZZZZ
MAANSRGVFADSRWLREAKGKRLVPGWDPEITVLSRIGPSGWRAALRIPFSAFGQEGPPREGTVWRANFCREEQPVPGGEYSSWAPVENSFHEIERWGILFFGKIPAAVISGVESSEPGIGANLLTVAIENSSGSSFYGTLLVRRRDSGKEIARMPVRLSGEEKQARLEVPYHLEGPGTFDFELLLMDAHGNELVYATRYGCSVSELLSCRLLQRELAGGQLEARLNVGVSRTSRADYRLRCALYRDSAVVASETVAGFSGTANLIFDTARLPPGEYELAVELLNPEHHVIARKTEAFKMLENMF